MLGFRQWKTAGQRRNWWARQISRQQSSNVPVTKFCQQLGVPASTFYEWRRRFAQAPSTSSQPVRVERPSPGSSGREPTGTAAANFVPVSILDSAAHAQLEIELTNACVVRVKGVIDPCLLQAAIAAAAKLDQPEAD
jgi:transposase-like protein